jgi:hypothetical protein
MQKKFNPNVDSFCFFFLALYLMLSFQNNLPSCGNNVDRPDVQIDFIGKIYKRRVTITEKKVDQGKTLIDLVI